MNNLWTKEHEADAIFGRQRMACTSGRGDDVFSNEDIPDEDDLLSEIIPEDRRLHRLLEIQQPFQDEGLEPYMSSCRVVSKMFNVPMSLLCLVYKEFQWFKANVGLDINHTARCVSFCAHTLTPERPEVLYVPDSLAEERFRNNELVHNAPHIRFYCGAPLVTQDGVRLGTLCAIDRKPRAMCKDSLQLMINLAELTVRELLQSDMGQKYKPSQATKPSVPFPTLDPKKLRRLPGVFQQRRLREAWFEKGLCEGVFIIDASGPKWCVVWTNSQWELWCKHANIDGSLHRELWSVLQPVICETGVDMQNAIMESITSTGECSFLARITRCGGESSIFVSCDAMISTQPIKDVQYQIRMPPSDIVPPADAEPISFDGSKILIVFVKPSQECLESTDDATRQAEAPAKSEDVHAVESTANSALSGTASTDEPGSRKMAELLSTFLAFDKEKTGCISRWVLEESVKARWQVDGAEDKIALFIDAHNLDHNGYIVYKDFLELLFAKPS